jgi:hypothetical protein
MAYISHLLILEDYLDCLRAIGFIAVKDGFYCLSEGGNIGS